MEFKPVSIPVEVEQKFTGDTMTFSGDIIGIGERNGRKLIQFKALFQGGKHYPSIFDDGILFSNPKGNITVTYSDRTKEKFSFLDTVNDTETYAPREIPMTLDELDAKINEIIAPKQVTEEDRNKLYNAIQRYVYASDDRTARIAIINSIDTLWPTLDKELVVYRGQTGPEGEITKNTQKITTAPGSFFSTSSEIDVSTMKSFFSHKHKCCVFILHIQPGVKYFEVGDLSNREEYEFLIEGGGTFYIDKEMTSSGFRQLTLGELVRNIEIPDNLYLYKYFFRQGRKPNEELSEEELVASTKTIDESELQKKVGVFEAYYFPPTREGGRRKRRKTYKNKKNRRRQTRRKI